MPITPQWETRRSKWYWKLVFPVKARSLARSWHTTMTQERRVRCNQMWASKLRFRTLEPGIKNNGWKPVLQLQGSSKSDSWPKNISGTYVQKEQAATTQTPDMAVHVKRKPSLVKAGGAKEGEKGKNVEKFLCRTGGFHVPSITSQHRLTFLHFLSIPVAPHPHSRFH